MKRSIIIAGIALALSMPMAANADPAWHVEIPAGKAKVSFMQHTACGAGSISTGAGYYSTNVQWRVVWPKGTNPTRVSRGGTYYATKHPSALNETRSHTGTKVYGKVTVIAVPKPGYSLAPDAKTTWTYTFKKPGRRC